MPPGSRLLVLASQWFDEQTVAQVFQPLIADLQHEWAAATAAQRRGIAWRGRLAFLTAFVASFARELRTPTPSWLLRRVLIRIAVFFTIVGVAGMVPVVREFWTLLDGAALPLAVTVVVLPILPLLTKLLPFAIAVGLDPIRGNETLPRHIRHSAVSKLLIATTVWMIVGGGWIVPATEQAWRVAVMTEASGDVSYVPPRGVRELSTYELVFHPDRAFVQRQTPTLAAGLELWRRVSLILLIFALAYFHWHVSNAPPDPPLKWWMGLAGSFVVTVTFRQVGAIGMLAFALLPIFTHARYNRARYRWRG